MPTNAKKRVLLVDDDLGVRRILSRLLACSYDVTTTHSGQHALDALDAGRFDLVVTDWKMPPGIDGVDLLKAFQKRSSLEFR